MIAVYDPDLHRAVRGNSHFIRDFLWNWCHDNIRHGYNNALRVRAREDRQNIKFWIDYMEPTPIEFEIALDYGEPMDDFLARVKTMFMLLEG